MPVVSIDSEHLDFLYFHVFGKLFKLLWRHQYSCYQSFQFSSVVGNFLSFEKQILFCQEKKPSVFQNYFVQKTFENL